MVYQLCTNALCTFSALKFSVSLGLITERYREENTPRKEKVVGEIPIGRTILERVQYR